MTILWFRRDLRIEDSALLSFGKEVMPVFIFDSNILNPLDARDKRVSFIYEQVLHLQKKLRAAGLDLYIFYGDPVHIFTQLAQLGPKEVIASVDYDSYARKRDAAVEKIVQLKRIQDCYIFGPDEILKNDQTPYLVFTPFYNRAKACYTPAHAGCYKKAAHTLFVHKAQTPTLEQMGFIPQNHQVRPAKSCLEEFAQKLSSYDHDREYLFMDATSHLGVHLRFGTISIRHVLRFLIACKKEGLKTEAFFRQLIFRDFYAYLLYHFPSLAHTDHKRLVQYRFDKDSYDAFVNAQTGVPVVDAAVIQLKTTGRMHNRARMIAASFFTKHLLLPWQEGEAFFAAYLLDFEKSSNVLSWQWAAGTGIDPQPYFRIFNPYTQAKRYDKDACYIKKYLPELLGTPARDLHNEDFLLHTGIKGYPKPVLIHKDARKRALGAKI